MSKFSLFSLSLDYRGAIGVRRHETYGSVPDDEVPHAVAIGLLPNRRHPEMRRSGERDANLGAGAGHVGGEQHAACVREGGAVREGRASGGGHAHRRRHLHLQRPHPRLRPRRLHRQSRADLRLASGQESGAGRGDVDLAPRGLLEEEDVREVLADIRGDDRLRVLSRWRDGQRASLRVFE